MSGSLKILTTSPLLSYLKLTEQDGPIIVDSVAVSEKGELPPNTGRFSHMPLKERSLVDFWAFLDLIEFKGGTKNFAQFHKELADFVQQPQTWTMGVSGQNIFDKLEEMDRRRVVLVPRGHLKSTLCSVAYVLWRIYRNPNIRICVATATQPLALQFVREIKQYLEDENLQNSLWNNRPHIKGRLVPVLDKAGAKRRDQKRMMTEDEHYTEAEDKKIVWRSDAIQVIRSQILKEPTVLAASPGSNITGMHYDLVIMDDIINDDTVATELKIEKTLEWTRDLESVIDPPRLQYLGQNQGARVQPNGLLSGLDKGTRRFWDVVGDEVLVLGTRYCKGDYYDYLLENQHELKYVLFFRNIYANGADPSDGYLWPEKFNDRTVELLKIRQKPKRFASQYLNQIIAEEEIIFRRTNLRWIDPSWLELGRGVINVRLPAHVTGDVLDRTVTVAPILFCDPAISQKKTADNTVIMLGGMDEERNLYMFDYRWGKMLPNTIVDNIFELANKYHLNSCWVEVVAFQKVLAFMIKQAANKYRPICVREFTPKGEKKGRITSMLEPYFENRKVWLMKHMAGNNKFMEEIDYFPQETVSDDFLDTMAMIVESCVPTTRRTNQRSRHGYRAYNLKYGGCR